MHPTLKQIQNTPIPTAIHIHAALSVCLEALQQTGEHEAEVQMAQDALDELGPVIQNEREQLLLGRLYQLGYGPDHALFRITTEDFASVLLEILNERNQTLYALTQGDLDNLIIEATDYLNSEGIDWRQAIRLGIEAAWPPTDEKTA